MAVKRKAGGSKGGGSGRPRPKAEKPVRKAFERTKRPPSPAAAPEAAYDDSPTDVGGAGVLPPFIDEDD